MQTRTNEETEPARSAGTSPSSESRWQLPAPARKVSGWLSRQLASYTEPPVRSQRAQMAFIGASIFLIAFGVRLMHWQDSYADIARGEPWMADLVREYKGEARRMLD